jgi:hypothetical protein
MGCLFSLQQSHIGEDERRERERERAWHRLTWREPLEQLLTLSLTHMFTWIHLLPSRTNQTRRLCLPLEAGTTAVTRWTCCSCDRWGYRLGRAGQNKVWQPAQWEQDTATKLILGDMPISF